MTESQLPFDEAVDYLFGRMALAARRRFEERLAQDAALSREVRELEEGSLALALSAPQLPAPRDAWITIQAALSPSLGEESPLPAFGLNWLWGGLSAAAALAIGLIVWLAWFNAPGPGKNHRPPSLAETPGGKTAPFTPPPKSKFASDGTSNEAGTGPVVENNVAVPTLSNQSSRLTEAASHRRQSLQIRRAQGPVSAPSMKLANSGLMVSPTAAVQTLTTQAGGQVDFLDFANPPTSTADDTVVATVIATIQPRDLKGGIYMFALDTNLMVSVDPATLPANTGPLTFVAVDGNDNPSIVGTVNLSANAAVINLGDTNLAASLGYIMVSGTNILGFFPP